MTCRQTMRGCRAARDDRRDPGIADPHVDAAPLGDRRICHRLVEVLVGDVAGNTRLGPGSASATAFRSFSVRATSATETGGREASREGAQSPAGAGEHDPLTQTLPGRGPSGHSIWLTICFSGGHPGVAEKVA